MTRARPADLEIEAQVDAAIRSGASLPRWGWPTPRSYNGATGEERIRGWQKVQIARRTGLLDLSPICSICAAKKAQGSHTELYQRCMTTKPVCRSCHFHIHRRFRDPDGWMARIAVLPVAQWVHALRTVELSRDQAMRIAEASDVFDALERLK